MSTSEKDPLILHNDYQRCFGRNGKPVNTIEINGNCATIAPSKREDGTLSPKKTYAHQGRQISGQDVEFSPTSEPFSQYTLADGTQVKVKIVLLNAARLDEYNEQGDPLYQFQFQHIIGIVPNEALKRKPQ
ncbi:MAG: hypothetical protein WBD45_10835 [Terriglobales bacterium]